MGQIYVPQINWALMFGTLLIVIGFGSSSAVAAAVAAAGSAAWGWMPQNWS